MLIDLVYTPEPTPLVSRARARGCHVFDGYDVPLGQAGRQFERMTGFELPATLARGLRNPDAPDPARSERGLRAGP